MKLSLDDPQLIQVLVVMTPAQLKQIINIEHSLHITTHAWGFRYALVVWLLMTRNVDKKEIMGALQVYAKEDGLEVVPRNTARIPFTIRPVTENVRDRYRNIKRMKHG